VQFVGGLARTARWFAGRKALRIALTRFAIGARSTSRARDGVVSTATAGDDA